MQPKSLASKRFTRLTLWLLCTLSAATAGAAGTGTLMLMVTDCGDKAIDQALVEVVLWRPGYGEIASDSDYTDNGYVEFEFSSVQDEDQARVTVTPPGCNPDAGHVFYWKTSGLPQDPGEWDLGVTIDSICVDGWWDKDAGIIQCVYRDPKGLPFLE